MYNFDDFIVVSFAIAVKKFHGVLSAIGFKNIFLLRNAIALCWKTSSKVAGSRPGTGLSRSCSVLKGGGQLKQIMGFI